MPIILQEHQKIMVDFILKSKNRSVLLYHGLGSGKTLTALSMADQLVKKYPTKKIIIIAPSSLTSNFEREATRLGIDRKKTKIVIESYGIFVNKSKLLERSVCRDSILIVDEVQNLNGINSTRFKHIFECARKAFKVILLSATPIKNRINDITNTLSLLKGMPIPRSIVDRIFMISNDKMREKKFSEIFKCNVSFYNNYNRLHYPDVKEHVVRLKMQDSFYKEYYKIQEDIKIDLPEPFTETKNLTVFLNGIRRAVNKTKHISPKIEWVVEKIISNLHKKRKILIYSNWLDSGLNIIKFILDEASIDYGEITGERNAAQKDRDVKKFNTDKMFILLVSASGSEGISLKGTRDVIILEPYWNKARIEQTVGRAIRFKSHLHLPENQRTVDIYYLILEKPINVEKNDKMPSADTILYKMSKDKDLDIQRLYDIMQKNSIEHNKTCF